MLEKIKNELANCEYNYGILEKTDVFRVQGFLKAAWQSK